MGLRFLTAGESHGTGITTIVEGMPAGMKLTSDEINLQLARRQKGYGSGGRMKIEKDKVKFMAGVRHNYTLGSPICMQIENLDHVNWREAMSVTPVAGDLKKFTRLVPGHADFAGALKYNHKDLRNVLERASARETAARVLAGAVAQVLLSYIGVTLNSFVASVGKVQFYPRNLKEVNWQFVENVNTRAISEEANQSMQKEIQNAKRARTTVGGVFCIIANDVPIGLGSHVHWDRKIDAQISAAITSINAVKGVQFGDAFKNALKTGHEVQDVVVYSNNKKIPFHKPTNHAGGIEGGMTNGNPIVVYAAIKPIATLSNPLPSVDILTGKTLPAIYNRSDVCQVSRACPVGEAMLAWVLAQNALEKYGSDSIDEFVAGYDRSINLQSMFGRNFGTEN